VTGCPTSYKYIYQHSTQLSQWRWPAVASWKLGSYFSTCTTLWPKLEVAVMISFSRRSRPAVGSMSSPPPLVYGAFVCFSVARSHTHTRHNNDDDDRSSFCLRRAFGNLRIIAAHVRQSRWRSVLFFGGAEL
jgi:hypothetical protein